MPFRVLPGGEVECDTAAEVIALKNAMSGQVTPQLAPIVPEVDDSTENYQSFWEELKPEAKEVMKVLAKHHGEALLNSDLATKSGLDDAQALTGVMVHIRHTGNRHSIDTPVVRSRKTVGRRMKSTYQVSSTLYRQLANTMLNERNGKMPSGI